MGAKLECVTACPDNGRRYSIASHDASYTGAKGMLRPLDPREVVRHWADCLPLNAGRAFQHGGGGHPAANELRKQSTVRFIGVGVLAGCAWLAILSLRLRRNAG